MWFGAGGPDLRPEIHDPTMFFDLWGTDVGVALRPAVEANRSPLSEVFIEACVEVGIAGSPDFNSGTLASAG